MVDLSEEPTSHTWCLFETDLRDGWSSLPTTPDHVWPGYTVRFPAFDRALTTSYGCLTSSGLRTAIREVLGDRLVIGRAREVGDSHVVMDDGRRLDGRIVIDGRGAMPTPHLRLAWQKFVGVELALPEPHGLDRPIVMDATVRQHDGFRFLYVLPLDARRLLVEDTRYSDRASLDQIALEAEILRYAHGQGWTSAEIVRRESGVLPVVLGGDIEAFWEAREAAPPQVGMAGAFFHPVTGYSTPDAVRVADLIADNLDLGARGLAELLRRTSTQLWRDRAYYRVLNRMLFKAADPDQRYRVLERFYRLPSPLIERFYAGRTTLLDKARILSGKPPVPVWRAMRALMQPLEPTTHD